MLTNKPVFQQIPGNVPKVLIFDLETSPNIAYIWGKYEQDALGDFIKERMIISIAWKFLGEKTVHARSITDYYGYKKNPSKNKKLIEKIHALFCDADILVAQNGDNFDIKMANAEFVQYGMTPPPPHKTVDTVKVARKMFRFNSNKLDDIGERLGFGRKLKTGGFELWKKCMDGNKSAWARMVKYNKRDVEILEKIYLRFRPWIHAHPNMNVLDLGAGCTVCKSNKIQSRGTSICRLGYRKRYQCQNCGKWSRGPFIKTGLQIV